VAGIHIDTYGPGFDIVQQMNPCTPYQAKFSLAYCVAAALVERRVGLEQFSADRFDSSGVRDTALATLLARTRVTVDPAFTARYPAAWPGRVTLALRDGTTLQAQQDYPRGNPENAVTTGELEEKFMSLVSPCIGRARAAAAVDAVHRVELCDDVSTLFCDLGRIDVVGDVGAAAGSIASHAG
jgi:2-methylcitrate dehydratase PrpD